MAVTSVIKRQVVGMSIAVKRVTDRSSVTSDDQVARSDMGAVINCLLVLDMLETCTDETIHSLVGYRGQEIIGLFPVVNFWKGPASITFSPPPRLGVPTFDPVPTNCQKFERVKQNLRNNRFVDSCFDWLGDEIDWWYTHGETTPPYDDVRLFKWAEYNLFPGSRTNSKSDWQTWYLN